MKTANLIGTLAVLCAATGSQIALAAPEYVSPAEGFVSNKTVEEVQRELKEAVADGSAGCRWINGDENFGGQPSVRSNVAMPTQSELGNAFAAYRRTHSGNMPSSPSDYYYGS